MLGEQGKHGKDIVPDHETKKRAAQEIAIIATPKTKYNRTISLLASPSNIARTHAGYASQ